VKLSRRRIQAADPRTQLAAGLGVEKAYFVDEPLWYVRATSRFRLSWRRELASVATVFAVGIAVGFLVGHL
jgi:hypothetical protein